LLADETLLLTERRLQRRYLLLEISQISKCWKIRQLKVSTGDVWLCHHCIREDMMWCVHIIRRWVLERCLSQHRQCESHEQD